VNWFNVLAITAGPFQKKSNQSELWQWIWGISDFNCRLPIQSVDCAATPSMQAIGNRHLAIENFLPL
jgi:hypothetical protein